VSAGSAGKKLCLIEDIAPRSSKAFDEVAAKPLFVVRGAEEIAVYVNSCPHLGVPLDWAPDRFLSLDCSLIVCGTHGAEFRVQDGFCISGPCRGKALQKYPHKIENGWIVIEDQDE